MYLGKREVENFYNVTSKLGKKFKKKRIKTIFQFECNFCFLKFEREKGSVSAKRLSNDSKHVCKNCKGKEAYIGAENFRKNRLQETPIGTIKKSWGRYPVIFIGYDVDLNITYNGGSSGYVRQHTYVMEKFIGRKTKRDEVVHHIDGDKTNNDLKNLVLMSRQEHNKCHATSESIVFELVKKGLVEFNRRTLRYELM